MFMMSGNPLSCIGGGSDRRSIRDIIGTENCDSVHRVLSSEEFATCVRSINSQIERSVSKNMSAMVSFIGTILTSDLTFAAHESYLEKASIRGSDK